VKKLIFILLIFIGCKSIKPHFKTDALQQTVYIKGYKKLSAFSGDTTQYLYQNFVKQKVNYVHKPLNILLQQLEVPLSGYTISPNGTDMSTTASIVLNIYDDRKLYQIEKGKRNPNALVIIWSKPLPIEEARVILTKSFGRWDSSAREYYSNKTVGSIVLTGF
jgi:hypothetical protein